MKKLLRPLLIVVLVAAAAFAVANLSDDNNTNNNGNETDETVTVDGNQNNEGQSEEGSDDKANAAYNYTAQSGDSYTKMARKAVQAYADNSDTELSPAQIVAAETFLTSDAGFPQLNLGQKIEFSNDTIKAAVDKAVGLDDTAEARWEKYVPNVDFDTSNVGEVRS